jgi:hypothetical protein
MKFKYTLDLLQNTIQRDNAVLISNHTKIEKRSVIVFRCHCGEEYHKIAQRLIRETGVFCEKCTLINTIKKTKDTLQKKYKKNPICTIESLHNIIERDNAILLEDFKEITINTIIHFICNCGKDSEKNCLQLIKVSGAFCKDCTRVIWTKKTKETNIKKYGVECTVHNPEIKKKIIKSNLEKYGVENVLQSEEIKGKIKKRNLETYGVEHYTQTEECRDKMKKTNLEKYGVENYGQTKECRDKMKQTSLIRYGVEHSGQSQEIQEKIQNQSLKFKEYTMPSGKIRKVQGYESFALNELVQLYKEEDILTNRRDIPRIQYMINDKNKYYFPDIYIKSVNKIIEVKSTWTYKLKTGNIKEKEEATKKLGYDYEIWIYDGKGEKIVT